MTKAEIIERIIDRSTDPWTDNPEDFRIGEDWTLKDADEWLAEARKEDADNGFDGDDAMPNEATPELVMEAMNCYRRYMLYMAKHVDSDDEEDAPAEVPQEPEERKHIRFTFLETESGYDYTVTVNRDINAVLTVIRMNLANGCTLMTQIEEVKA